MIYVYDIHMCRETWISYVYEYDIDTDRETWHACDTDQTGGARVDHGEGGRAGGGTGEGFIRRRSRSRRRERWWWWCGGGVVTVAAVGVSLYGKVVSSI
jgi:hypothetical protein